MNASTQGTALWYASRATGVVSLLLLTLVVILGIMVNRQGRLPGLPHFAVTGLHRSISLLSIAFIGVHIVTAIADPYVSIRAAAVVIPFVSAYEPFWLGLGAVALDLIVALILTSLIRSRISRRIWRGIHWLAYLAWPVAFVHGIGASPDLRSGALRALAIGCALAVGAAALWRGSRAIQQVPRTERAASVLDASRHRGGRRPATTTRRGGPDQPYGASSEALDSPHRTSARHLTGSRSR